MNALEQRLNQLFEQKRAIEDEIETLQKTLQHSYKELSKDEKIELFKTLFVGRLDCYAKKWISKDSTKHYFFPVTKTYKGEDYLPLSNEAIETHLRGQEFLATFPILHSNVCKYLVLKIIQTDAIQLKIILNQCNLSGYFEVSSSNDYKVWLFFSSFIDAKKAKALGEYLLQKGQINGEVFPNQEFVNASNLGKSLELPLNLKARHEHKTVFADISTGQIIPNQWEYLQNIIKVHPEEVEKIVQKTSLMPKALANDSVVFPQFELKIILYDGIYISTDNLSKSFLNLLKSYACFDNPQVKVLIGLRKPLYNIPKIIKSFQEEEGYLKLPRGLWKTLETLLKSHHLLYDVEDKRNCNQHFFPKVVFSLREEQEEAISAVSKYNNSICVAPPGFGKTLIGAKMVEIRQCNTLVIVNKNMLLNQWIDRFSEYFNLSKKEIGFLGKGQDKLNGVLDVATMQSLKNAPELIHNYSFVIVDECHHIPAITFEQIVKVFKGKYLLGLSATPNRKDGLEPILYQQLGEVAYEFKQKKSYTNKVKVVHTDFESNADSYAALINEICTNEKRNRQILEEIKQNSSRSILILTDRLEHISELERLLDTQHLSYLSVHGNLNKKEQTQNMEKVRKSQLILATTSFFGEGIDFPHLNTIIFATPISYYGRLIQYLGRIGRNGQDCLAIDFLDSKNAMLNSAYKKRKEGYKQMHYRLLGTY